ncbi:MAG TPA: sugar phosphate nucleotidyltransferase, partial [Pyrinomonadaceae bacterium]|nr:sugar phosphate nucleotidyltransferase [Pyrinomonadaceae bacterium]
MTDGQKPLNIVILAAGLGTRMRSDRAKVLHRLDGRPLIDHVCQTAVLLSPQRIYFVVGHQAEEVKQSVANEFELAGFEFVRQEKQLGTGDAVNSARPFLAEQDSTVLVLSGDVPLIRESTLRSLIEEHERDGAACTFLTVKLANPFGYGRIVRDSNGQFSEIVEQKDASEPEKLITEINSGIYCFDSRKLFDALEKVQNKNAQREYYLTDVPRILREAGETVSIFLHDRPVEVEGVNDRKQLAAIERMIHDET